MRRMWPMERSSTIQIAVAESANRDRTRFRPINPQPPVTRTVVNGFSLCAMPMKNMSFEFRLLQFEPCGNLFSCLGILY